MTKLTEFDLLVWFRALLLILEKLAMFCKPEVLGLECNEPKRPIGQIRCAVMPLIGSGAAPIRQSSLFGCLAQRVRRV